MANLNDVQLRINQLSEGDFQILFDRYLTKKYNWDLIPLGTESGTSKTTKGTPDSYVQLPNGNYIFINHGSVKSAKVAKIKSDIESCLNEGKKLGDAKIEKIVCCYLGSNLSATNIEDIKSSFKDVEIGLISSDTIAMDLIDKYPYIISEELPPLKIGSDQLFDSKSFIRKYDNLKMSAPLDTTFSFREQDKDNIINCINENKVAVITGPPGVGKTRLGLEICKYYETEGFNVYCVRNNGLSIFDDIRTFINEKNIVLFFDDINETSDLTPIFQYISELDINKQPKLLCTVRDYAKQDIILKINRLMTYKEINLTNLTASNIEELLKEKYGINNQRFLDRINTIAKGNPRLAMLAGKRLQSGDVDSLFNTENIFQSIFDDILNNSKLDDNDILFLCILSITGGINYKESDLYHSLCDTYIKTFNQDEIINKLRLLELIDYYKNTVIKINDQSFRDYVLYFALYKKKIIKIEDLINKYFIDYKKEIASTIQALCSVFPTKDLIDYVTNEVRAAWDKTDNENEKEFVKVFGLFNETRALLWIKGQVDGLKVLNKTIDSSILKEKEKTYINNEYIQLLYNYSNHSSWQSSYQLAIKVFESDPTSTFWDLFIFLSDKYIFNKNEYVGLEINLDCLFDLFNKTKDGNDTNYSFLYLRVCATCFKNEFDFSRQIDDKSFKFGKIKPGISKDLVTARKFILESFNCLFNNDVYKHYLYELLNSINYSYFRDIVSATTLFNDEYEIVYDLIKDTIETNLESAIVLNHYENEADKLNVILNSPITSLNNRDFILYKKMYCLDGIWMICDDDRIKARKIIKNEFKDYTLNDYETFFLKINEFKSNNNLSLPNKHHIAECIEFIFEYLKDNETLFKNVLIAYWNSDINELFSNYSVIDYLMDRLGYNGALSFIKEYNHTSKIKWVADIYASLKDESINLSISRDFKNFISKCLKDNTPILIDFHKTFYYWSYDNSILKLITSILRLHPELTNTYLPFSLKKGELNKLLFMYSSNMSELKEIYLSSLNDQIDYDWTLFWGIYSKDKTIWSDSLPKILDDNQNKYMDELFGHMWDIDDYTSLVDLAFDYLFKTNKFIYYGCANKLFISHSDEPEELIDKKKNWFITRISKNVDDREYIKAILQVMASTYPRFRNDLLFILIYNKCTVDEFKIFLDYSFPLSQGWSGSEVPLIENKISSLMNLSNYLGQNIDLLPFKKIVEDKINLLDKHKDMTEIREYLDPYISSK